MLEAISVPVTKFNLLLGKRGFVVVGHDWLQLAHTKC